MGVILAVLAALEGLLERLRLVLGRLEGILDRLGGILGRLGGVLEASWGLLERLGGVLERLGLVLREFKCGKLAWLGVSWGRWRGRRGLLLGSFKNFPAIRRILRKETGLRILLRVWDSVRHAQAEGLARRTRHRAVCLITR